MSKKRRKRGAPTSEPSLDAAASEDELSAAVVPVPIDDPPPTEAEDLAPEPLPRWLRTLDRFFPAAATLLTSLVLYLVMSAAPGTEPSPILWVGVLYVALGAVAVLRLRARGELMFLRPRGGDLTFGALVTLVLYGAGYVFHALVTAPGQPRFEWVLNIYLRLGDPFADSRFAIAIGAGLIGALEELTWRGAVTPALEERLGLLVGNVFGVALYAAAHVATMWALAGPKGLNPLLVLASAGCGVAWTYLRFRSDQQLAPVLFSHALFTWSMVEFPLFVRG